MLYHKLFIVNTSGVNQSKSNINHQPFFGLHHPHPFCSSIFLVAWVRWTDPGHCHFNGVHLQRSKPPSRLFRYIRDQFQSIWDSVVSTARPTAAMTDQLGACQVEGIPCDWSYLDALFVEFHYQKFILRLYLGWCLEVFQIMCWFYDLFEFQFDHPCTTWACSYLSMFKAIRCRSTWCPSKFFEIFGPQATWPAQLERWPTFAWQHKSSNKSLRFFVGGIDAIQGWSHGTFCPPSCSQSSPSETELWQSKEKISCDPTNGKEEVSWLWFLLILKVCHFMDPVWVLLEGLVIS